MERIQAALSNSRHSSHTASASESSNQPHTSQLELESLDVDAAVSTPVHSDASAPSKQTATHLQTAVARSTKHDDVRSPTVSLPDATPQLTSRSALLAKIPVSLLHLRPGSRLGKRPLSAAPVSLFKDCSDLRHQLDDGCATTTGPQQQQQIVPSAASSIGVKRPLSASAITRRYQRGSRPVSQRTESTASSAPRSTLGAETSRHHEPTTHRDAAGRAIAASTAVTSPLEARNFELMASYHSKTFVYAVPVHCLEPSRRYNPYDIVTLSHVRLKQGHGGTTGV